MKRYGKNTIKQGMRIRYNSTNRIYNTSPAIIDTKYGEQIGYITYDLFYNMLKSGKIKKDFGDYWYAEYIIL